MWYYGTGSGWIDGSMNEYTISNVSGECLFSLGEILKLIVGVRMHGGEEFVIIFALYKTPSQIHILFSSNEVTIVNTLLCACFFVLSTFNYCTYIFWWKETKHICGTLHSVFFSKIPELPQLVESLGIMFDFCNIILISIDEGCWFHSGALGDFSCFQCVSSPTHFIFQHYLFFFSLTLLLKKKKKQTLDFSINIVLRDQIFTWGVRTLMNHILLSSFSL